jgi:isocitrate lyase
MTTYTRETDTLATLCQSQGSAWKAINPEYASRMRLQNRFRTGIEIAQYTADVMREDMAAYDKDTSQYTQSLGCWHGFTAQQMMMAIKRHQKKQLSAVMFT